MRTTRPATIAHRSAWRATTLVALVAAASLVAGGPSFAQSSASFQVTVQVLNAGGRPEQAIEPVSPAYRLSLESIGGDFAGVAHTAPSFRLAGGLGPLGAPPGEVTGLEFLADAETLRWSAEPRSMVYNVYRGALASPPGGFGVCAHARVEGRLVVEPLVPAIGAGFFYLVTGENLLAEEGTKGYTSAGAERPNSAPCP